MWPFFSPKWFILVPTEHAGPEIRVSDSPTLAANVSLMLYMHSPLLRITFSHLFLNRYGSSHGSSTHSWLTQIRDTSTRFHSALHVAVCTLGPYIGTVISFFLFVCLFVVKFRMVKGLANRPSPPERTSIMLSLANTCTPKSVLIS